MEFKYKEIELDSIFRNEISNFNKIFSISSSNKKSICQIFKVIKSCISGYLIKQAYYKLTKNRIKNFNIKQIAFYFNFAFFCITLDRFSFKNDFVS